jgi:predicted nucleic acid-binding protein
VDTRRSVSTVYAESSAVLRWLLGAVDADRIERALIGAGVVVTSDLTTAEVGRALQWLAVTGQIDSSAGARAWAAYAAAMVHWRLFGVTDPVLHRVRQPFPSEPVRTLDAIHLATATLYGQEVGPLAMLSTDHGVRANAEALGLAVLPAARGA